ncbi:MAG TPA: hypothetical protein VGL71_06340 [Urbifossiella sp.]
MAGETKSPNLMNFGHKPEIVPEAILIKRMGILFQEFVGARTEFFNDPHEDAFAIGMG